MIYYLKGKIVSIIENNVIIDVRDVAYQILVSHPDEYSVGDDILIYTHNVVREDENYLVGFKTIEEKHIFLSLIKVKGLGPRSVINALSTTTPQSVINAIASNNVAYLKKLPGIGAKAAAQILLDLKAELSPGDKGNPKQYEEVYEALKSLGFKGAAIDRVLATINEPNSTSEDIVRIALQKLRK
jgi:Holliday junction DNA helicase RuvA